MGWSGQGPDVEGMRLEAHLTSTNSLLTRARHIVGRTLDRIARQMSVPCSRLDLGVAQELAYHRQPLAGCDGGRREGVPKVVDPDVLELSTGTDALPEGLKIGQAGAREGADDHPGIRSDLLDARQDVDRWLAEMDDLGAGFGVCQAERLGRQVHVLPLERHDLAEPAAGQDQQPGSSDG